MGEVQKHLYVLILAGGGGTRLWPMSRNDKPKQFAKLFSGKSLFEITLERAQKLTTKSKIFVSTSSKYISQIKKLAPMIPHENIISEPMRRDTAMAHGLGALYIYNRDPEAVIANFASDHLISPMSTFVSTLNKAADAAFIYDYVVTVGLKPRYAHTGLGHIKAHKQLEEKAGLLVGEKFVEKPDLSTAKKYTDSRQYYWNADICVYKARLFLDLLKKHSPKTCAMYPKIVKAMQEGDEKSAISLAFQMAPSISIDYAIWEKLTKFICVPASFNWTDVGDWQEVWKNLPHDKLGNVIAGPNGNGQYIGEDSSNNLIFLDKPLIATVGIKDMVIVETEDALLICPKDDSQSVKKIVEMLKIQKLDQYL